MDDTIPVLEAAKWLARMAARDGVVSANDIYMIPDECIPDDGIIDIKDCEDFLCDNTPEAFRSHLLRFY